nr:hypothetical protein GCM10020093_107410 [Planobispora longispora]
MRRGSRVRDREAGEAAPAEWGSPLEGEAVTGEAVTGEAVTGGTGAAGDGLWAAAGTAEPSDPARTSGIRG